MFFPEFARKAAGGAVSAGECDLVDRTHRAGQKRLRPAHAQGDQIRLRRHAEVELEQSDQLQLRKVQFRGDGAERDRVAEVEFENANRIRDQRLPAMRLLHPQLGQETDRQAGELRHIGRVLPAQQRKHRFDQPVRSLRLGQVETAAAAGKTEGGQKRRDQLAADADRKLAARAGGTGPERVVLSGGQDAE